MLSAERQMLRLNGNDRIRKIRGKLGLPTDEPLYGYLRQYLGMPKRHTMSSNTKTIYEAWNPDIEAKLLALNGPHGETIYRAWLIRHEIPE